MYVFRVIILMHFTVGLSQSETVKKKSPQNTITFLVPTDIPELAASEFFSNFVWTPEGAPIILLKV